MALKIKIRSVYATYYRMPGIQAGELEENVVLESVEKYDESGHLTERVKYLPKGDVEYSEEFIYKDNKLVEEFHFFAGNDTRERKTYSYTGDNISEERHYFMDGSFDSVICQYDENYKLKEKFLKDEEGNLESKTEYRYLGSTIYEIITNDAEGNRISGEFSTHDDQGNLLTLKTEDAFGNKETVENTYDDLKQLVISKKINENEQIELRYEYNRVGKPVKEEVVSGGNTVRITDYVYNEEQVLTGIIEQMRIPGFSSYQKLEKSIRYEYY